MPVRPGLVAFRLLPVLFLLASIAALPEQPAADLPAPDAALQSRLEQSLRRDARLGGALDAGRLSVALLDISDPQQRVRRSLHPDQLGVGANGVP